MQNFFQEMSKKGLSTKKFHEIIVKAFFINTTNENYLNPTLIPNILLSCQLLNRPQLYLLVNAFNNYDTHFNDNCHTWGS